MFTEVKNKVVTITVCINQVSEHINFTESHFLKIRFKY